MKRKSIPIVLLILLILSITEIIRASSKDESCTGPYIVITKKLNKRSGPGTNFSILGTLKGWDEIYIEKFPIFHDNQINSEWTKICELMPLPEYLNQYGGKYQGEWIYKKHITNQYTHIGHFFYIVCTYIWKDRLDNKFSICKPNASFLIIQLIIKNKDKEPRTIPPFELIDENHAKYETSNGIGLLYDDRLGLFTKLNPEVYTQGWIVFDVPKTHKYKLKVSGGYWSEKSALIDLNLKH